MKFLFKIILPATLLLFAGCSKRLLEQDAPHILVPDNLYVNKAGFEAGLNGLYDEVRRMRSGTVYGAAGNVMLTPAFIGVDNAYGNWRDANEDIFNLWGANNNASAAQYRNTWAWLYETINAANTITTRAEKPGIDWTAAEKNLILAEARFIRGWCYRHLTYLWGDVPVTLEESSGSNIKTDWVRTPLAEVRKKIEEDFLFAEAYIPVTSPNQGKFLKGAVQHYLAELYLAMNDATKAKEWAQKVIQTPEYKLVTQRYGVNKDKAGTPFTDMFVDGNANRSQGNTEALWVIQNELNVIGGEGSNIMRRYWVNRYYSLQVGGRNPIAVSAENGGRGIGRWGPTKFAMDLYGAGDDRGSYHAWRLFWIINNPSGIPAGMKLGDTIFINKSVVEKLSNPNWPNTRKWDYASPIDVNVDRQYNDQVYVRLAETYLLLAEAHLKLNDPQAAADAINVLRNRAKAGTITSAQVTLDFILDERSRELFAEEERRYTLVRTRTWYDRVKLYNKIATLTVTQRDTLLPVPQDVIDANRTMKMPQNAGY